MTGENKYDIIKKIKEEAMKRMVKKRPEEYSPDELESVVCGVEEQETSITRYRGDDTWDVWTSDNTVLTKMKKLMAASPEECKLLQVAWNKDGTPAGYEFSLPKKCVKFSAPRKMSEEQRAALAERFAKAKETAADDTSDDEEDTDEE